MTESQVVNEWTADARLKGEVKERRMSLLEAVDERFPGALSEEYRRLLETQDSLPLLRDWFSAAIRAKTFDEFLAVVRR